MRQLTLPTTRLIVGLLTAVILLTGWVHQRPAAAGECIGVQAYVTVGGTTAGAPTKWCVVTTDCGLLVAVGPQHFTAGVASTGFGIWTPNPSDPDPSCLL